ncbi:hypothetical protein [Bradyrhizobium sp. SZCCHNR3107]|uniref:hypothetical protein n=1 Tax=Bradyrhizobium sp. SZCCHNR3107 TaxID=3057459 RepID=UPI0028EF2325|nr:hypothetical protein [Bradyrhizobium sp. SZCCHNR3107]
MTVNVDAGGEPRSGSSVIEVRVRKQPQFLPEVGPVSQSVRGQAAFIELPGGKNLIALLASGSIGEHQDYPREVVPWQFKLNLSNDRALVRLPVLRGQWELATDRLPTLVTVGDPNDAATAQVVRSDQIDRMLGVHLRSITIEMTADAVPSPDIETKLPFLVTQRQHRLEITRSDGFTPNYSSFVRN